MKKLEYISSSGTQYIDTGIKPNSMYTIEIKVRINTATTHWDNFFGTRDGANARYTLRFSNYTNGTLQAQKSPSATTPDAYYDDTAIVKNGSAMSWHIYKLGQTYSVDGTVKSNTFASSDSSEFPYNLYLLTINSAGTAGASDMAYADLAYCKLWDENGTLVRDFVPAKDNNDVVCLYDKVSGSCFYNGGTGTFTAGPEIFSRGYLIESGGDYYTISGGVLTNVGSTLNAQLFEDYGMSFIPDWSDISSLPNPSVLCWDVFAAQSMTATTSGAPSSAQAVISQSVPTGDGIQDVTITSDNATLYSVSFDNGSTWWKYTGGAWSQVSSITDGMTKAEMELISSGAWADKNTGHAKIRFTLLDENGYMTRIVVGYESAPPVTDVTQNGTSVVNAQGVAEVTVPTNVSDLNNDSGFVTDNPTFTEASTRANIASGESFATILGKIKKWFSDLASMFVSKTGDTMSGNLEINKESAGTSEAGSAIIIGNSTPVGTVGNSTGVARLYSRSQYYGQLIGDVLLTANRNYHLPDASGTIALTSDLPQDSGWISDSNYAYRKIGSVVLIEIGSLLTLSNGWTTIGTLPNGYHSTTREEYGLVIGELHTPGVFESLLLAVRTSGNVQIYSVGGISKTMFGSVTLMV